MAEETFPGDVNTIETEWPYIGGPDGVVADLTGEGFDSSLPGGNLIEVAPGIHHLANFSHFQDAPVTLDPNTELGVPASGQERWSWVAIRYDWSAASLSAATSTRLIGGVAAAEGTAVLPSLVKTVGDRYELPLCPIFQSDDGTVGFLNNARMWAMQHILLESLGDNQPPAETYIGDHLDQYPVGTVFHGSTTNAGRLWMKDTDGVFKVLGEDIRNTPIATVAETGVVTLINVLNAVVATTTVNNLPRGCVLRVSLNTRADLPFGGSHLVQYTVEGTNIGSARDAKNVGHTVDGQSINLNFEVDGPAAGGTTTVAIRATGQGSGTTEYNANRNLGVSYRTLSWRAAS